jgi:hypothetical protein
VAAVEEVATPRMRGLLASARGFRDLNDPLHSLQVRPPPAMPDIGSHVIGHHLCQEPQTLIMRSMTLP